jgi:glutamate decarboxylase
MTNITKNAKYLSEKLFKTGYFESLNPDQLLPVVALKLKNEEKFTLFDLSDKVREKGWIISAYTLPANAQDVTIMRMVVRENFSRDMCDIVYKDIVEAYKTLSK